jgi:hypothetical protein
MALPAGVVVFLYRLWKRSAGFERSRQSRLGKTERKAKKSFFFFQERVRCKPGTPAGGEGRGDVVGVAALACCEVIDIIAAAMLGCATNDYFVHSFV